MNLKYYRFYDAACFAQGYNINLWQSWLVLQFRLCESKCGVPLTAFYCSYYIANAIMSYVICISQSVQEGNMSILVG